MKADLQGRCYRDFLGRVLYVSPSLTNGTTWMTVYSKENGSLKRVKSKWLPLRVTRGRSAGGSASVCGRAGDEGGAKWLILRVVIREYR